LTENTTIVELSGIVKDFVAVRALNDVDFTLHKGEVHVLVGENGAGKSTLAKILAGVHQPDRGTVELDGRSIRIHDPAHAQRLGIGVVYQELDLVPSLTVAQNLSIGHEPLRARFIVDASKETEQATEILDSLSLDIDPAALVRHLSLGQQQMVAFARALSFAPNILVLDEPTSSLTAPEIKELFVTIRGLKARGVGIIYISHRLEELFEIGDRITVLRDGQRIGTSRLADTDLNAIIRMMVGRDISEMYPREATPVGEEALRLEAVSREGVCEDINLVVRRGEVVGLSGLVGAGRTELARIAFGLDPMDSGRVSLLGKEVARPSPSEAVRAGIGFLPEDRKQEGLCTQLPLKENVVRAALDKLFPKGWVSSAKEEAVAHRFIEELDIATPSSKRLVVYLSGGTQQKVVLAQWLCAGSDVLILDEPTRGIDVGTKVEIYRMMNQLTKRGVAILMISSELPEVMGMSDRIYVMCRGEITGEFARGTATAEQIVSCAFGAKEVGNAESP